MLPSLRLGLTRTMKASKTGGYVRIPVIQDRSLLIAALRVRGAQGRFLGPTPTFVESAFGPSAGVDPTRTPATVRQRTALRYGYEYGCSGITWCQPSPSPYLSWCHGLFACICSQYLTNPNTLNRSSRAPQAPSSTLLPETPATLSMGTSNPLVITLYLTYYSLTGPFWLGHLNIHCRSNFRRTDRHACIDLDPDPIPSANRTSQPPTSIRHCR